MECWMLIRSKCVFVLMAHFDKSLQAEWHLARPTMEKLPWMVLAGQL